MRIIWTTVALLLAAACPMVSYCQTPCNMVHNPSFEDHVRCPERIEALGVMSEADAWWQPTAGSSDYFNTCGGRESAVPRNKLGFQEAHTGNAYCGIYCSQESYREYLQTELAEPLAPGRRYHVAFWVSLADKSPHAIASLGALLTRDPVEDTTHGILMKRETIPIGSNGSQSIATQLIPQVSNPDSMLLDNMKEWVEISGDFIADGGERFLTIGNFFPFNKSRVTPSTASHTPLPGAYYYIDDVSVVCLDCHTAPVTAPSPLPEVGTTVILKNLYFATDKSEVLPQSYNELAKLKSLLDDHPSVTIELSGHTDNQGTVEYNQRLSENRAKAVADYLAAHGIDPKRLNWKGYGESRPVADNSTDEGRQLNRRVEYRILHQ